MEDAMSHALCICTLPYFLSVRIVPMADVFSPSLPYTLLERTQRMDVSYFFLPRRDIAIKKGAVHTNESSQ